MFACEVLTEHNFGNDFDLFHHVVRIIHPGLHYFVCYVGANSCSIVITEPIPKQVTMRHTNFNNIFILYIRNEVTIVVLR